MGYYDFDWKNLPVQHKLPNTLPALASLAHDILIFPIFFERRKLESIEKVQNANLAKKGARSLESFLINCLVIAVSTLGMLNTFLIINKYENLSQFCS